MDQKKGEKVTSLPLSMTSWLSWWFWVMSESMTPVFSLAWLFSLAMMFRRWSRFSSSVAIIALRSRLISLKSGPA
jgi:hypothetical protein